MAEKEDEPTPAEDIVVTKYKMAGDMVNGILVTCQSIIDHVEQQTFCCYEMFSVNSKHMCMSELHNRSEPMALCKK